MDQKISLMDESYKKVLKDYNKLLKFKNNLLSTRPIQFREQVLAIDRELAPLSFLLTQKRTDFLKELGPILQKSFHRLFSRNHELSIFLDSKLSAMNTEEIFKFLRNNSQKDEAAGRMIHGVHRDDYLFFFDGMNALDYCSLGQQKMALLGLIFAYIELFRYKFDLNPVLLIDDVSGELDRLRWSFFINYLEQNDYQVLMTTANESFKDELAGLVDVKRMEMQRGLLIE